MPETPPPTPPTPPAKPKRTRGPVNQRLVDELTESGELAATAAKTDYASDMADEGIDADFLTALNTAIADGLALVALANNSTAGKSTITGDEETLKKALLKAIGVIQNRAKRKYTKAKDPGLDKYFVNKGIEDNRSLLETASAAIIETLKTDTLPKLKPEEVNALKAARAAYVGIQTDQSGAQGDATTARTSLEAKVTEVAGMRRQLQLAADLLWPADDADNKGTRREFKLPPDKALA